MIDFSKIRVKLTDQTDLEDVLDVTDINVEIWKQEK